MFFCSSELFEIYSKHKQECTQTNERAIARFCVIFSSLQLKIVEWIYQIEMVSDHPRYNSHFILLTLWTVCAVCTDQIALYNVSFLTFCTFLFGVTHILDEHPPSFNGVDVVCFNRTILIIIWKIFGIYDEHL